MATLWELEGDLAALEALLAEDASVDEAGQVNAQLDAWLTETEGAFASKVESYVGLMESLNALADARKAEAKRVQELERQARNKADRLKAVLREVMLRLGRDRVESTRYKVRLQKAGGALPLVIDEFVEIPEQFLAVVKSPDRVAIRAALESGKNLPFAALGERGTILVIK